MVFPCGAVILDTQQQGCFTANHGRRWIEDDFPLTYLVSPFIHPLLVILMNGVPLGKGTDETVKTLWTASGVVFLASR